MEWRRLSEREGGREPDGPYEGVPAHLKSPLIDADGIAPLVGMLRLLWPNPDRHAGQGPAPALEQAQAVVQLATTIVQWTRDGVVRRA
jgi:hypothetical protein